MDVENVELGAWMPEAGRRQASKRAGGQETLPLRLVRFLSPASAPAPSLLSSPFPASTQLRGTHSNRRQFT